MELEKLKARNLSTQQRKKVKELKEYKQELRKKGISIQEKSELLEKEEEELTNDIIDIAQAISGIPCECKRDFISPLDDDEGDFDFETFLNLFVLPDFEYEKIVFGILTELENMGFDIEEFDLDIRETMKSENDECELNERGEFYDGNGEMMELKEIDQNSGIDQGFQEDNIEKNRDEMLEREVTIEKTQ